MCPLSTLCKLLGRLVTNKQLEGVMMPSERGKREWLYSLKTLGVRALSGYNCLFCDCVIGLSLQSSQQQGWRDWTAVFHWVQRHCGKWPATLYPRPAADVSSWCKLPSRSVTELLLWEGLWSCMFSNCCGGTFFFCGLSHICIFTWRENFVTLVSWA